MAACLEKRDEELRLLKSELKEAHSAQQVAETALRAAELERNEAEASVAQLQQKLASMQASPAQVAQDRDELRVSESPASSGQSAAAMLPTLLTGSPGDEQVRRPSQVLKDCGQRGRLFREIPKPEAGADGPKSLWPEATCEGYGLSSEARAELRASNRQAEENARQSGGLAEELLTLYRQQFNRDPKTAAAWRNFRIRGAAWLEESGSSRSMAHAPHLLHLVHLHLLQDHLVNFAQGLQRKLPYRAAAQLLARSPKKV
ncbi:unnamed protein product [Symbiodinium natans]|uniref:Uncharacterized protein n=1 Tax=Symbiodinium natans TaxID=878477 RepID=A0A812IJ84_9DINO|nr:unnamed protein product [Symbiodinium natans]